MLSREETAAAFQAEGYNCAQAVFLSFCDELEVPKNAGARLVCTLGTGFAGTGGICGAVSAACLAVSLKHGRDKPARDGIPMERQKKTYALAQQLQADFERKFGATDCPALLQKGLAHSGGENDKALCPQYVRFAARLADAAVADES